MVFVSLAVKTHAEDILEQLKHIAPDIGDLVIITSNGSFTTSKQLVFAILPHFWLLLCDYCLNGHDVVRISIPDVQVNTVKKAFEKVFDGGGDIKLLSDILSGANNEEENTNNKAIKVNDDMESEVEEENISELCRIEIENNIKQENELTEIELKEESKFDVIYEIEGIKYFPEHTPSLSLDPNTDVIVAKYNRVMARVAKQTKKMFVPLVETSREEIPGLLASFFNIIRTKNGDIYNESSLSTFLNAFGRYFGEIFDPPIDIKKDVDFDIVRTTIANMKKEARATEGKKPGENASRALAPRHLRSARELGYIGRDNLDALNAATFLAFTTGLGCRAVREVNSVTNRALIIGPIGLGDVPEFLELDEQWVSKNRIGNDPTLFEARVIPDHDTPDTCHVRTIMEMMRRKTDLQCLPDAKFWWNVKEAARLDPLAHEKWYKNNHAGKHSIEKFLTKALSKAGVDCQKEKYSATSARKSMLNVGQEDAITETILGSD